jgi:hypothetical protein
MAPRGLFDAQSSTKAKQSHGANTCADPNAKRATTERMFTWADRLLLAMADLGAHPPLLATELAPTLAGFLGTQGKLQNRENCENAADGLRTGPRPSVGDEGLEPSTPSLSSWCSSQLS